MVSDGAPARRGRRRRRRAHVQAHHGLGLRAGGEERIPVAGVQRGEPEPLGELGEGHRVEAARGVGADLGRAFLGVEQPRELQRDDAPRVRARPHVELPVVGRAHDRTGELRIAHPELVALTREPGERRREAQRRVHAVEVHVVDAGVDVVGPPSHLVEPGRVERPLVQRLAHHRVESDLEVLLAVVEPVLGGAVVLGHHTRRGVGELRRYPTLEHVRRLHEMVVDRDQGDVTRLVRRVGEPVDLGRLLARGLRKPSRLSISSKLIEPPLIAASPGCSRELGSRPRSLLASSGRGGGRRAPWRRRRACNAGRGWRRGRGAPP